jgi:manganese transport protein
MEGFLEIKISPVLRAFLTRTCAILPSLLVTIIAGDEYAEFLIVISSVFLSFQLPYALIPLVKFCGCEKIVGAMAIDPKALQRTWVMVSGIIFANIVLLCVWVHESGAVNGSPGGVFLGLFVAVFMVVYCVSLLALALRPVTQNLTMQVRDRLEGKDFNQLNAGADGGDDEYL